GTAASLTYNSLLSEGVEVVRAEDIAAPRLRGQGRCTRPTSESSAESGCSQRRRVDDHEQRFARHLNDTARAVWISNDGTLTAQWPSRTKTWRPLWAALLARVGRTAHERSVETRLSLPAAPE